jgi:hypothetical protein
MNGLAFSSYRAFMKMQLKHADDTPTLKEVFLAGFGVGVVGT